MATPKTSLNTNNHELLILVSGKVDSLAEALTKSIENNSAEFEKIWKHADERDQQHSAALQLTADKLASAIAAVAEKQSDASKPNIQAIASVLALIGAVAVAFIAPIKADIERSENAREELAKAVLVKEDKIQSLQTADSEFREKQKALVEKADDLYTNGSPVARERLAVIENDLKWMRGEKTHKQPDPAK